MANSRKIIFIEHLQEGQRVDDLFLVAAAGRAETKAGKPYLTLTLRDKSGEIAGRLWENADRYADEAVAGQVVRVQGSTQSFRDELQLKIESLARLSMDDEAVNPADYLPVSPRAVREMLGELDKVIASFTDQPLAALLRAVFQNGTLDDFALAPAAKKMHHAYLGGLLEHTLSVSGLAMKIAEHYPGLDRDLLVAGALLHDLGKIHEFSYRSMVFDYTDSGRLLGHMILGGEMVRKAASGVAGLAHQRLEQLLHLILSHHGRHEFGAPVLPMTLEAILLHHLDDMDSKVNYIDLLSEKVEAAEYQWSEYQRPLERYLLLRKQELHKPAKAFSSSDAPRHPSEPSGKSRKKFEASGESVKKQKTLLDLI